MEASRLDAIINVDTSALLRTLKDLEVQLSESYRQDVIPSWAASIIPRIVHVEAQVGKISPALFATSSESETASFEDLAKDERIFQILRAEIDAKTGATRLGIDSKVTSLSMELDRVHKLLQIRPTTSEFQKVMLAVYENELKIQRVVGDMTGTIQNLVRDQVVNEMASILDNLKANETANEQSIKGLFKKVDGFSNDVAALKAGIEKSLNAVNSKFTELKDMSTQSAEQLLQFRAEMEATNRRMQASVNEGQRANREVTEALSEHRAVTGDRLDVLERKLHQNIEIVGKVADESAAMESSLRDSMSEVKANLDSFRAMYQLDADEAKVGTTEIRESLAALTARQEESGVQLKTLVDADLITATAELNKNIYQDNERILNINREIQELVASQNKAGKLMTEVADMLATIPTRLDHEESKSRIFENDIKSIHDFNKRLQTVVNDNKSQLDDLSTMRDELTYVRDMSSNQEHALKTQQTTTDTLMQSLEQREKHILEVEGIVKSNDDRTSKKIDEIRREFMASLVESQQELNDKISTVQDNIEIGGSSSHHPTLARQQSTRSLDMSVGVVPYEEQITILSDHATQIAELCISYEEVAVRKNTIPEFSESVCETLAGTAQALAQFIAACADGEAIQHLLRNRSEEVVYEDMIVEKRKSMIFEFIQRVVSAVEANHPQTGIIRAEAREKFTRQLAKAMDVALSKHDQVMVPGSTRFGRIKIPTCIACDRPLLNKVRQDGPLLDESINFSRSSQTAAGASPTTGFRGGILPKTPGTLRLSVPRNDGHNGKSKATEQPLLELDSFVLRGGFKMPKNKLQLQALPDAVPATQSAAIQMSRSMGR
eukprot:gene2401-4658_t